LKIWLPKYLSITAAFQYEMFTLEWMCVVLLVSDHVCRHG